MFNLKVSSDSSLLYILLRPFLEGSNYSFLVFISPDSNN